MSEKPRPARNTRPSQLRITACAAIAALVVIAGLRAWEAGDVRAEMSSAALAELSHDHGPIDGSTDLQTIGPEYELEGRLTVLWGDTQDGQGTAPLFNILLDDGTAVPAVAATAEVALALAAPTGQRLAFRVADTESDTPVSPGLPVPQVAIISSGAPAGGPAPSPAPITGSHPWITVLCKFADYPGETWSHSAVNSLMTNAVSAPGLDYHWRQVSYNTFDVAGSAMAGTGWFSLPSPRSAYGSSGVLNFQKLVDDCTAAADASVNFAIYSGVNMMFNANLDINGAINAAWGGSANVTADGAGVKRMTWMPTWAGEGVLAHEMGHGFGLPHSWSGYGISYGSAWDVMSSIGLCNYQDPTWGCYPVHTISDYKDRLGVIPAGSKFTPALNSKQVINLAQLDTYDGTAGTYMMVRIPSLGGAVGSGFDYYTMELRRQNGAYDRNTPAGPTGAVVIHEVLSTRTSSYGSHPAKVVDLENDGDAADCNSISFCIDVANDARWVEGEVFWDQTNQVMFKVLDLGSNGIPATVAVRYGNPTLESLHTGFDQQPSTRTGSGEVLFRQPIVSVQDFDTLPNTNDNSSVVTLQVVPPGPILSCSGGNSRTVDNGVASFSGCSLTGTPGFYQLEATSPGLTTSFSSQVEIAEILDCTGGDCVFDFTSDDHGFSLNGLWHRETVATPAGMSAPTLAFNQGCDGNGINGCNYVAGTMAAGAVTPLLNLGNARLMTFKSVRVTDNSCGQDFTSLFYSTDGATYQPLQMGSRAGVTSGTQFVPLNTSNYVCGNSAVAQEFSVVLPAGTMQVAFVFQADAQNNVSSGWFIDDIQFTVPLPAYLRIDTPVPDQWYQGVPFSAPGQPSVSVRTASGATVISDNSTQITLSLLQNGSTEPSADPLIAPTELAEETMLMPARTGSAVASEGFADDPGGAPPAGTLTCSSGLTLTAVNGVATFTGCQVNTLGTNYQILATSGSLGGGWLTSIVNIVIPQDCDAGQCDTDFSGVTPYTLWNLAHIETVAAVSGMTSPMLAFNQGCTGPGVTGCTYDTGGFSYGDAVTPLIYVSGANRLEFSIARDTAGVCGQTDRFYVLYTFDRISAFALNLETQGTISPGGQYLSGMDICGNSSIAQQVAVTLPAGVVGVRFIFYSGDTVDNNHAGVFVDDVAFTVPIPTPHHLQWETGFPNEWAPGVAFGPLNQPKVSVRDAANVTVSGDNTTLVTLSLIQNGGSGPAVEPSFTRGPGGMVGMVPSGSIGPSPVGEDPPAPAPPEGTLTCDSGLTVQAVNGIAQFSGCRINTVGTGYQVVASSTGIAGTVSPFANIFDPLLCDNGQCEFDFTEAPRFWYWGLYHRETLAEVSGMSGPMMAANQGCTGPGLTGCNFVHGSSSLQSGAITPLLALSTATRLEFDIAKDTGTLPACGSGDGVMVLYTFDRWSYYFLDMTSTGGSISPGGLSLNNFWICGNSVTAQHVSLNIPSGVTGVWFWFESTDNIDNDHPGVFIDNVEFVAAPTGPASLAFIEQPPANIGTGLPFDVSVAVLDGGGQTVVSDNATAVTIGLLFAGTLTCDGGLTQTASSGIAEFTGCSIDAAGLNGLGASSVPPLGEAFSTAISVEASTGTDWYFAEGFTGNGWETYLYLLNATSVTANVTVTYFRDSGPPVVKNLQVSAQSRTTLFANDPAEGPGSGQAFGVTITSDQPITAQQALIDTVGELAHGSVGSQALSQTWYFAEGFTGNGWLTFISATNPSGSSANVTLTYHKTDGSSESRNQVVGPFSRYTFAGHADVPGQAFSVSLSSDVPIVAQEVLIDTVGLLAHGTIGATTTGTAWHLAEGFTGDSWLTFISVGNLSLSPATVTATYNVLGEAPVQRQIVVPSGSRGTFAAHDIGTGVGPGKAFGVTVSSDQPVVVQEVLIDPKPGVALAHGVLAGSGLASAFTFAGGTSEAGWLTFVSVTNPSGSPVTVDATYFFEAGPLPITRSVAVGPNSRMTFASFDAATGVPAGNRFGVKIVASAPVISQEVVIDVVRYLAYSSTGTGGQ